MATNIPTARAIAPTKFDLLGDNGGLDDKQYPIDIAENQSGILEGSFHIDHLKNTIIKDVARPNMFKVKIIPPSLISKKPEWQAAEGLITALAKKADFPEITIKDYLLERAGQKLFIPTNEMDYGEVSITFINDSEFLLRSMFNNWQRLAIHNWQNNIGSIPLLALEGSVSIHHFDSDLKEVYSVKLTNAWPTTISSIDMSQDSENGIEEFTVTFKFTMHQIFKAYS